MGAPDIAIDLASRVKGVIVTLALGEWPPVGVAGGLRDE